MDGARFAVRITQPCPGSQIEPRRLRNVGENATHRKYDEFACSGPVSESAEIWLTRNDPLWRGLSLGHRGIDRSVYAWLVCALCAAGGCVHVATASTTEAGPTQPNLVFILADDQGVDAIEGPAWSNELNCRTPRLAEMAAQGRTFANARANPNCSPTRAGILSGRNALRTGVMGVIRDVENGQKVAMQSHERTIAEVLRDSGYTTILVGKWHCGFGADERQRAVDQGFDLYIDKDDFLHLDDPMQVGDEHISRMVDLTVEAFDARDRSKPIALFFWTIDPHLRRDGRMREPFLWWRVHHDLLPSGEEYYKSNVDSNRNRYRAVVEALDTEVSRMLFEMQVIDRDGLYRDGSNTVVVYMGDNGTPQPVAPDPLKSKKTLYEGGIHVPLFVFGEGVPNDGVISDRIVSHVDIFETFADIADVPGGLRGAAPRDSISFADQIGWAEDLGLGRQYAVSSLGAEVVTSTKVSIVDDRYKIIAPAGHSNYQEAAESEFYDLWNDPLEEHNLMEGTLTEDELTRYFNLRDAIMDEWPSAAFKPLSVDGGYSMYTVDIPVEDMLVIDSLNTRYIDTSVPIGHRLGPDQSWIETRMFLKFDPKRHIPRNAEYEDLESAYVLLVFDKDSDAADASDTGNMTLHPMRFDWSDIIPIWRRLEYAHFENAQLGSLDLPPHALVAPGGDLSAVPLPSGTPVAFNHNDDLRDLVVGWYEFPRTNFGIAVKADPVTNKPGDQQVHLFRDAVLRLTFRRDPK